MAQSSKPTVLKLVLSVIAFFGILVTYLFYFKGATMEMTIAELWRMLGVKIIGMILVVDAVLVWLFGEIFVKIRTLSGKEPVYVSGYQSIKHRTSKNQTNEDSHVVDLDHDLITSSVFKALKKVFSEPTIKTGGSTVVFDSDGQKTEVVTDSDSDSDSKRVIEFKGGKVILDDDFINVSKEVKVYKFSHRSGDDDD